MVALSWILKVYIQDLKRNKRNLIELNRLMFLNTNLFNFFQFIIEFRYSKKNYLCMNHKINSKWLSIF